LIVLHERPPSRPAHLVFTSIASLFAAFEALRTAEMGVIQSPCGHQILLFDHHFFHLAAISRPPEGQLSMPREQAEILATVSGFGRYELAHGGSRARNLGSTVLCLKTPDEVWVDNPVAVTAKWVYLKQFDSKPYPYAVVLVGERPAENGIIVPFSGFECDKRSLRKWRQGNRIYSRQEQPPEGGCP
jgi:hypothetical protein